METPENPKKNSLWFILNHQGYCVAYKRLGSAYSSGYLIYPTERVSFSKLITILAREALNNTFYDPGVEVSFDTNSNIPDSERQAIETVVQAIEVRHLRIRALEQGLKSISTLSQDLLRPQQDL